MPCYQEIKGEEIQIGGTILKKSELIKEKNDKVSQSILVFLSLNFFLSSVGQSSSLVSSFLYMLLISNFFSSLSFLYILLPLLLLLPNDR